MSIKSLIEKAPAFNGYQFAFPENHLFNGAVLTGATHRPANFFFEKLFEGSQIMAIPPGYAEFGFAADQKTIRNYCKLKAKTKDIVSFSANGIPGYLMAKGQLFMIPDFSAVYGKNVYRISYKEIQKTLDSQKIYAASPLPIAFYRALKQAMQADQIVILPGNDKEPLLLKEMKEGKTGQLLAEAEKNPKAFGFSSTIHFQRLMNMTLYQIGAFVVKSEDYRVFCDGDGKILERTPGQNDAVRLINACGIRAIRAEKTAAKYNSFVANQMFKTALKAAEIGIAIIPAVGMGVWKGDPDLYWRAFLDAVVASDDHLEHILVQPGHQETKGGLFEGCKGEEFEIILNEFKEQFKDNPKALAKLNRIANLFDSGKDVVQLARILKQAHPEKTISLVNASDPDVTLGFHVGEYVNHIPHTTTTEENYTAMGTNGLCFEAITGVHDDPSRLIQV